MFFFVLPSLLFLCLTPTDTEADPTDTEADPTDIDLRLTPLIEADPADTDTEADPTDSYYIFPSLYVLIRSPLPPTPYRRAKM